MKIELSGFISKKTRNYFGTSFFFLQRFKNVNTKRNTITSEGNLEFHCTLLHWIPVVVSLPQAVSRVCDTVPVVLASLTGAPKKKNFMNYSATQKHQILPYRV